MMMISSNPQHRHLILVPLYCHYCFNSRVEEAALGIVIYCLSFTAILEHPVFPLIANLLSIVL